MEKQPFYMSISELGKSFRDGTLSPLSLTEILLDRASLIDPKLNAYRMIVPELAMAQAEVADKQLKAGIDLGPLHGIPFVAKDLFDFKGIPTSAGCKLLENNIANETATSVANLLKAGMVFLGKTNTVQFAFGIIGTNKDHGTPINPWHNIPHVPGGSSSGSAVAVAAGLAPVGLGTDTGGSVRVPSSLCGTTGLKTTVGRVSRYGVYPVSWTLDSVGPLARTVEDVALIYMAIQGYDPLDESTWNRTPNVSTGMKNGIKNLRIGIAEGILFENTEPDIESAVRDAARVLKDLGAHVESFTLKPLEKGVAINIQREFLLPEAYMSNRKMVDENLDKLDPVVVGGFEEGKQMMTSDYTYATLVLKKLRSDAVAAMQDWDVVLAPTTSITAKPVDVINADMDAYKRHTVAYLKNTKIGNALNLCGLSVPCGFSGEGLPIGLQIYAKPFHEEMAIRVGNAFQAATRWHLEQPATSFVE